MGAPNTSSRGSRRETDKKRKRADILLAAEELFRKRGYRLATTDEIARESGYSVGTLYNLFEDKEGLYAEVLERIGHELLARLDNAVLSKRNTDEAIESLIKLRLYNYIKDRMFFQPFSCDGDLGLPPDPARLPRRVAALYQRYLDAVAELFRRALERAGIKDLNPYHLALSLEGLINAFMGYWSKPKQSDSLAQAAEHIKKILLSPVDLKRITALHEAQQSAHGAPREIYMSRFDMDRLKELIAVAHAFGTDRQQYLEDLEAALLHAKVVNPKDVPADLVTMNSRVRLREAPAGKQTVCRLVFPKDADSSDENLSILDPFGTALLGNRIGDVFEVRARQGTKTYRLDEILYQPEAAGDYHL